MFFVVGFSGGVEIRTKEGEQTQPNPEKRGRERSCELSEAEA